MVIDVAVLHLVEERGADAYGAFGIRTDPEPCVSVRNKQAGLIRPNAFLFEPEPMVHLNSSERSLPTYYMAITGRLDQIVGTHQVVRYEQKQCQDGVALPTDLSVPVPLTHADFITKQGWQDGPVPTNGVTRHHVLIPPAVNQLCRRSIRFSTYIFSLNVR